MPARLLQAVLLAVGAHRLDVDSLFLFWFWREEKVGENSVFFSAGVSGEQREEEAAAAAEKRRLIE